MSKKKPTPDLVAALLSLGPIYIDAQQFYGMKIRKGNNGIKTVAQICQEARERASKKQ